MDNYQKQLTEKAHKIEKKFVKFLATLDGMSIFESPSKHFRLRAEFRFWHERDSYGKNTGEAFYAMFEPGRKPSTETLKRIDYLPVASKCINNLMPKLLEALKAETILLIRLFQVEFLSTLNGDTLVSLIYHKSLDDNWQCAAKALEKRLGVHIIGRSRGQKIVLSQDFVTEKLEVLDNIYHYRQIEGGFTQPNAVVCQKMLTWVCHLAEEMEDKHSDLLEIYCGNGNFTLPLSKYFRQVLATEVAKTSVNAARQNISANHCDNIAVARLSAEELTQAFNAEREFKRLIHDNININHYAIKTVFVDPPRAGIDDETLKLMQRFENILYISCNPDTLYDNLQTLKQSHQIKRMALFDQFPYTHHVEMGVWLKKQTH